MKNKKVIWLRVTMDRYEFPLDIADSAKEMSEKTGKTIEAIRSSACAYDHGRAHLTPFRRVEVEWNEAE